MPEKLLSHYSWHSIVETSLAVLSYLSATHWGKRDVWAQHDLACRNDFIGTVFRQWAQQTVNCFSIGLHKKAFEYCRTAALICHWRSSPWKDPLLVVLSLLFLSTPFWILWCVNLNTGCSHKPLTLTTMLANFSYQNWVAAMRKAQLFFRFQSELPNNRDVIGKGSSAFSSSKACY